MKILQSVLKTVWPFLGTVLWRFVRDQGSVLSGNIAYSLMLAVFPFLIFATALTGFFVGPEGTSAVLGTLFEALPEHVARTIEPVLLEVIGQRRGGILTISALGAVWAASNAVESIRIGLDLAYDVGYRRHVALTRLIAIVVVIGGFAVFTLLAALIIFAPLVFQIVQETSVGWKFDAWGSIPITLHRSEIESRDRVEADYFDEMRARLPVRPLSALAMDYGEAGSRALELWPVSENETVSGLVFDGIVYIEKAAALLAVAPYLDFMIPRQLSLDDFAANCGWRLFPSAVEGSIRTVNIVIAGDTGG